MSEDTIDVLVLERKEKDTRPLLVVKVGSKDLVAGKYPWIPTAEQLQFLYDHLDNLVGDMYRIFVYHMGLEIEVHDVLGREEVIPKLIEVTSFDEVMREVNKDRNKGM